MKRQYVPIALLLFLVFIGISALQAQHYDDLYYNPQTDYAHFYGAQSDKNNSDRENKDLAYQSDKKDESNYDDDNDGYFYSSRIRRFHRPARFYYYELWNSPWDYYDPWFVGPSIGFSNNFYFGYNYNPWNSWGSPYCYSSFYNPWPYHNWNCGFGNSWGMGNNYIINNYYGNGWYGNGWNPYYTGWNNPYNNHYYPGGGGGNWGAGGTTNPKGVVKGPRQTGGISTPTPPVRNQHKDAEPIKNGRNPRVDAQRAESMNPAKPEAERNIRGRDSRDNPAIKDRPIERNPQTEQPKRHEDNRQIDRNPQFESPRRESEQRQIERSPQNERPRQNIESRDNRNREPQIRQERNSGENVRRKNMAENSEHRYSPPARSNDYERSYEQPRHENRSESRSFDNSTRFNSGSSRSSSGNGGSSHSSGGGHRGRN